MKLRVLGTMLFVSALGATSALAQAPGVTNTEVTIGITTPLSGPAAAWSATGLGAEAWAKHVNDQGGVYGRKIKIVMKDDGYNPGRALANVNEMKDSVFALVGLLGTAVLNATKDSIADAKLPTIWPYGNPQVFAKQPKEGLGGLLNLTAGKDADVIAAYKTDPGNGRGCNVATGLNADGTKCDRDRFDITQADIAGVSDLGREELFGRIVLEVQRTLDNVERQFSSVTLTKILVGPEAEDTGLVAFLQANLAEDRRDAAAPGIEAPEECDDLLHGEPVREPGLLEKHADTGSQRVIVHPP